jgi:hypothetical protein
MIFPERETGKPARPDREALQPIRGLQQRITVSFHALGFSCVGEGAVYDAIAAIFAAFKPVASSRRHNEIGSDGTIRSRESCSRCRYAEPDPEGIAPLRP